MMMLMLMLMPMPMLMLMLLLLLLMMMLRDQSVTVAAGNNVVTTVAADNSMYVTRRLERGSIETNIPWKSIQKYGGN